MLANNIGGSVNSTESLNEQPLGSVTSTLYFPAGKFIMS